MCIRDSQRTSPENWLRGERRESRSVLSADERAAEMVMMGLRLAEGVNGVAFKEEVGAPLADWLAGPGLERLLDGGLLLWRDTYLTASRDGRLLLHTVLAELLP